MISFKHRRLAPGDQCSGLTWTYDAWGNHTDQTVTGGTCNAFHNPATTKNQLSGSPYVYDIAGNLINDGNHTYAYDAENRIISVDNGATTYNYDAQGHRVTKTTSTGWRNYLYDTAGQPVAETTSPGWQVGYGYLSGQLLTQYRDSTTYFFQHDHLGSTRIMTALNQNVYDSLDYRPYGEQIAGATGSSHKFTGKERDAETGLDYFGARLYGSSLGRWMSPDWAEKPEAIPFAQFDSPQTLNLYAYVSNNPLSKPNIDGHFGDKDKDKKLPPPDAQHNHTITVRYVEGRGGNAFGHVTVQIDGGKEVGYTPKKDMTKTEIFENKPVPAQVEPRADGVKTLDQVTFNVTGDQAKAAQQVVDDRTANPGNYQPMNHNCTQFGAAVLNGAGVDSQPAIKPSDLVSGLREQQYDANSTQPQPQTNENPN